MKVKEKTLRVAFWELELAAWLKEFSELSTKEKIILSEDDGRRKSVLQEFSLSEITGGSVLLAVEKTGPCEFLITYGDEDEEIILNRKYPPSDSELKLLDVM